VDNARTATDAVSGRAPDFFIVGHPKCGTTALYEMLRGHPEIYMPDVKEPHFFMTDVRYRNAPTTLDDYLLLFAAAKPGQRVGEASVLYLWSRNAARDIAMLNPAARIIAIFREPADFLRSLHLQMVETYVEIENDFSRALSLENVRRQGRHIPRSALNQEQLLFYSDYVHYVEQLRRYDTLFSPANIMILIYDDFRRDNQTTLRRVLRFLDVDDTHSIVSTEANPTVRVRAPRLHQAVHAVSVGDGPLARAIKTGIKTVIPRGIRRSILGLIQQGLLDSDRSSPDEELMTELRRRFEPEVIALSEYLDRDLVKLWEYDQVSQ
jgi:hypothetical protein